MSLVNIMIMYIGKKKARESKSLIVKQENMAFIFFAP